MKSCPCAMPDPQLKPSGLIYCATCGGAIPIVAPKRERP
jgi:hypothetical protein